MRLHEIEVLPLSTDDDLLVDEAYICRIWLRRYLLSSEDCTYTFCDTPSTETLDILTCVPFHFPWHSILSIDEDNLAYILSYGEYFNKANGSLL